MGWLDEPSYAHLPGARRHILDEVGRGFWCGITGGSAYHFLGGLRHSPNGERLAGGARAALAKAPRVAGSWAAYFGVWEAFENAFFFARGRDDPWNTIAAGAATSGFVRLRRGARAAARSALGGAAFIALLEGLLIFCDKHMHAAARPELPPAVERVVVPAARRPPMVDRLGRPLRTGEPERHVHRPEPRGFLGIPPGAPIVVKEVPASDLGLGYGGEAGSGWRWRRRQRRRQSEMDDADDTRKL